MPREIWRTIPGYEGQYEVSNLGRVKSLRRLSRGRYGPRTVPERILRPGPAKADLRVFAASPAFDCVKVEAHLKALDLPVPWFYWAERDYRTIRERNKNVPEAERVGHHNALGDAKHQAQHLIRIRQHHVNKAA